MVMSEIRTLLEMPHKKKPIIRIHFMGKVPEHVLGDLKDMFSASAILSFKKDLEDLPVARSAEEQKISVQELGRAILLKNLKGFGLDEPAFESVFELLLEKKDDEAMDLLIQKIEGKT
jgi:hypothetical protein